jgi:hypothetical protein
MVEQYTYHCNQTNNNNLKTIAMQTIVNNFGEKQTKWSSHKHPSNSNYMQVVNYMHIQFTDGRNHLYWSLSNPSINDYHMISDIKLNEAIELYTDSELPIITESDFEEWINKKK